MSYDADDFFDDVVSKAKSIDDIASLNCDPRGLPAFIRRLVTLYGEGDFARGAYDLFNGQVFLLVDDGSAVKIVGYLPEGYELVLKNKE